MPKHAGFPFLYGSATRHAAERPCWLTLVVGLRWRLRTKVVEALPGLATLCGCPRRSHGDRRCPRRLSADGAGDHRVVGGCCSALDLGVATRGSGSPHRPSGGCAVGYDGFRAIHLFTEWMIVTRFGHWLPQIAVSVCVVPRGLRIQRHLRVWVSFATPPTSLNRRTIPNMAKALRCRLRLHAWEYRENPETQEHYQVCVRCNAYRDRGTSPLGGNGAWGLGG